MPLTRGVSRALLSPQSDKGFPAVASFTYTTTAPSQTATIQKFESTSDTLIDWGDGEQTTVSANTTTAITHTYASAGAYTVGFDDGWNDAVDIRWNADTKLSGNVSAITWPTALQFLFLNSTSMGGDMSAATWPTSLLQLYLGDTNITGNISAITLPPTIEKLALNINNINGDLSGVTWPSSLQLISLNGTNIGVGSASGFVFGALTTLSMRDCDLDATEVSNALLALYNAASSRTATGGTIDISGNNQAPTGTYTSVCPPTDGKSAAHGLLNDGCSVGFNVWTSITVTGGLP